MEKTNRLIWTPEDPENEPVVSLSINGEPTYELTRQNTTLFTFLGKLAIYNHAFYADVKDDEVSESFYIFSHHQAYQTIHDYMVEKEYPAVLNQVSVSAVDQEAYFRSAVAGIGDTFPSEWLE